MEDEIKQQMNLLSSIVDFTTPECVEPLEYLFIVSADTTKRFALGEGLVEWNYVAVFRKIWAQLFPINPPPEYKETVDKRLCHSASILWNCSDVSTKINKQCIECGVHADIFRYLDDPKLDSVASAQGLLGIIFNMELHCDVRNSFRECSAFRILQKFMKADDMQVKCVAQILLASIITEDERDIIDTDDSNIIFLIQVIDDAFKQPDGRSHGFQPYEMIYGLNKLAANDSNKERIVKNGGLPYYVKMMGENCTEQDQYLAARGIWLLAFKCKGFILNEPACMNALDKLASSPLSKKVKREASGALWILRDKEAEIKKKDNIPSLPSTILPKASRHVMISYQWDSQPMVLQLRDELKKAAYNVWIDVDDIRGSIVEAMASAVENAAIVLVCVSQKYKESPNCRMEAEYALERKVDMIPLIVESQYKPDGWLGLLCGKKLYFSFKEKGQFDSSFACLVKEIGDRGKHLSQYQQTGGEKMAQTTNVAPSGRPTSTRYLNKGRRSRGGKIRKVGKDRYFDGDWRLQKTPLIQKSGTQASLIQSSPVPYQGSSYQSGVAGSWSTDEVRQWLVAQGLAQYTHRFAGFDGKFLMEYLATRDKAPEFFYARLHDMGMTLLDIMKFTWALRKL